MWPGSGSADTGRQVPEEPACKVKEFKLGRLGDS